MPMLLLNDEAFQKELKSLGSDAKLEVIKHEVKTIDIKHGRGARPEVPAALREIIAEESINGARPQELVNAFGVSRSSISAYKNGATSTSSYHSPDEQLATANDAVKDRISNVARGKLMDALDAITSDKLNDAKVRDVASIAQNMSGILKNMEPTNPQQQNNVKVVIYKPRQKEEDDYDVITVNE